MKEIEAIYAKRFSEQASRYDRMISEINHSNRVEMTAMQTKFDQTLDDLRRLNAQKASD
jgi:BarA-like signal transduction histidine kinase